MTKEELFDKLKDIPNNKKLDFLKSLIEEPSEQDLWYVYKDRGNRYTTSDIKYSIGDGFYPNDIISIPFKGSKESCEKWIEENSKKEYRPFKSCDELINTYSIKLNSNIHTNLELPIIWIKDINTKYQIVSYIKGCNDGYVSITKGSYVEMISLKKLFQCYTFLDGSVIGKEV